MTYAGARGTTARQMVETLHFQLPPAQFHPALGSLGGSLIGIKDPLEDERSTALARRNTFTLGGLRKMTSSRFRSDRVNLRTK